MGYDLQAFFDFDQSTVDKGMTENKIIKTFVDEYMPGISIVNHYYNDLHDPDLDVHCGIYYYETEYGIHHIYTSFGTNFIRDDCRLSDRVYQNHRSKEVGRPFPDCLSEINWYVRDRETALEVADALDIFFVKEKDDDLQQFSKWLRFTAKYCTVYELSY